MFGKYSVTEVAQRWGLQPRTVRAMIEAGRLQGTRVGARWFIEPSTVDMIEALGLIPSTRRRYATLIERGHGPNGTTRSL